MYNSISAIKTALTKEVMNGCQTKQTYESIGVTTMFDASKSTFEGSINFDEVDDFISHAATAYGTPEEMGPYKSQYYNGMLSQLRSICEHVTCENKESRQFVIEFMPLHCFESIQLMLRQTPYGKNFITVIANMRSCNVEANFIIDSYFAAFCGHEFEKACLLNRVIDSCELVIVNMNFGSLHIFKSEVDKK